MYRTPNNCHAVAVRGLLEADAEDAIQAAVAALGLTVRVPRAADDGIDLIIEGPAGPQIKVQVQTASLVSAQVAKSMLDGKDEPSSGALRLIVAKRITADARRVLNDLGLSWLDLRGHIRLVGPGLFVDADTADFSADVPDRGGIYGQVGVELAVLVLLDPDRTWGVREAAAALSRAPSSVSQAFAAMRAAHLVADQLTHEGPDLFWELAQHWAPASIDVADVPGPGRDNEALRLGLDDVETTVGWALTDTVAAAHYGAPVAMRSDHPLDFYVPDRATLRRAVHLLGSAPNSPARAARIRVAPVPAVCARRVDAHEWATEWPLANPLFVALDLAQDPGRGREILQEWRPSGRVRRVW
jgi:hypothetical protein